MMKKLDKGKVPPVLLISGEEEYLKEVLLERMVEATLGEEKPSDFNYQVLEGGKVGYAEIADLCETRSFLSPMKVIVVKEAEKISAGNVEDMAGYVENPADFTVLCLLLGSGGGRSPLKKIFSGAGAHVEVRKANKADARRWIQKFAKDQVKGIDPEAINLLLELVGFDLFSLKEEVEKCAVYAGPEKKKIGVKEVEDLTGRVAEAQFWVLTDSLLARDLRASLKALKELIEDGKAPVLILAPMEGILARIIAYRGFRERGEKELLQALGFPSNMAWKLKAFQKNAPRFSERELARISGAVAACDLALRSAGGREKQKLALEAVVMAFCGGKGAAGGDH